MTTSAQVYYRKWRPGTFSDLAGQEHVANTLKQAVLQDRVSHSYLFCGTRGSGKTTTARVLAKAVNCLDPQRGDPATMRHLRLHQQRFILRNIIELDAQQGGVDATWPIALSRSRPRRTPENRRKVYSIDEATDVLFAEGVPTMSPHPAGYGTPAGRSASRSFDILGTPVSRKAAALLQSHHPITPLAKR